jgi:hypothetical protein
VKLVVIGALWPIGAGLAIVQMLYALPSTAGSTTPLPDAVDDRDADDGSVRDARP